MIFYLKKKKKKDVPYKRNGNGNVLYFCASVIIVLPSVAGQSLLRLAIPAAYLATRLQFQSVVLCCGSESHPIVIPFISYRSQ